MKCDTFCISKEDYSFAIICIANRFMLIYIVKH